MYTQLKKYPLIVHSQHLKYINSQSCHYPLKRLI
nr:MAG TPA: hypothetical protein [Caudoviricetes sp.]